ncbi:Uma2 family endonuclease [Pendulispora albinea]|uniref:Uma2 family endonuclease n=1 Tax=Pendulispora albinea TaxID=2741071 RepID=A0ABZ2LS77_9BACT
MPKSAFTLDGFRAWVLSDDFPEGVKASFIDGEVFFEMSPESLETHLKVKQKLTAVLVTIADDESLGEAYADGALLTNEEAGISTEPDMCFATWKTLESGKLRKLPREGAPDDSVELIGVPDLVVEVVSKSSVKKDRRELHQKYARAGISEYWIIDARKKAIQFEILRLEGGRYVSSAPADVPQPSLVLGRQFVLLRSKNRIGHWTYRFEITNL